MLNFRPSVVDALDHSELAGNSARALPGHPRLSNEQIFGVNGQMLGRDQSDQGAWSFRQCLASGSGGGIAYWHSRDTVTSSVELL